MKYNRYLGSTNFFQTNADLCGQDRVTLSEWFWTHGSPSLLLDPIPEVRESNRAIEPLSGL